MSPAASTYVICTRTLDGRGRFGSEPGPTHYLKVPQGQGRYDSRDVVRSPERWRQAIRAAADGSDDGIGASRGDVLVFVHGYNNDIATVLWRTECLQRTLAAQGWKGVVVAFDWPSDDSTLNYLEDRTDAASVAYNMVRDGIGLLVQAQNDPDDPCDLNIHLLAHSTGAYVVMDAFAQAQKVGAFYRADWKVAQVALIGADVSSASLGADSEWARPLYDRCVRLTNYANRNDRVLGVSNAKRLGTAPRAGRIGLPADAHPKSVNVDCSDYFVGKNPATAEFRGTFNHSWHIGDPVFALDLAMTLEAGIDRLALPTRHPGAHGPVLQAGQRPAFQPGWDASSPREARTRLARGTA